MIDIEKMEKARKLIIYEGKTQEEVAKIIGVSDRTLANWSSSGKWVEKRRQYPKIMEGLNLNTLQLLNNATCKAIKTLDNQDIYAVIQLHMCIGNSNNQLYYLRPLIIKDLIESKKKSLKEVAEFLGLKEGRVKQLYNKSKELKDIEVTAPKSCSSDGE